MANSTQSEHFIWGEGFLRVVVAPATVVLAGDHRPPHPLGGLKRNRIFYRPSPFDLKLPFHIPGNVSAASVSWSSLTPAEREKYYDGILTACQGTAGAELLTRERVIEYVECCVSKKEPIAFTDAEITRLKFLVYESAHLKFYASRPALTKAIKGIAANKKPVATKRMAPSPPSETPSDPGAGAPAPALPDGESEGRDAQSRGAGTPPADGGRDPSGPVTPAEGIQPSQGEADAPDSPAPDRSPEADPSLMDDAGQSEPIQTTSPPQIPETAPEQENEEVKLDPNDIDTVGEVPAEEAGEPAPVPTRVMELPGTLRPWSGVKTNPDGVKSKRAGSSFERLTEMPAEELLKYLIAAPQQERMNWAQTLDRVQKLINRAGPTILASALYDGLRTAKD